MEKLKFYGLTQPELEQYLVGCGKQKFRAQQLFRWVYGLRVLDFDKMTNLSKAFRQEVPELLDFTLPELIKEWVSEDGTRKYLFDMGQGRSVEAVLIPSKGRLTLCVSTEVGCNMACRFCFTGKQKLVRRLETWEVVGQFVQVSDSLPEGTRITNVVFMGMGEPLDNPDAVFRAVEIWHNPWGYNFSRRKVTVSTSGLIPQIPLVTASGTRLAVSLNATTDEVRNQIMPINRKWPLRDLLEACRKHAREAKDKVTLEYVLLKGITDSIEDARRLYKITKDVPCKINIIPFNEHPDSGFERPDDSTVDAFQDELMRLGIHVLRRKTMGRDIYAACGQLTTAYKNHPQQPPPL
ncbi:MAG: 23S rRNA (adenine(2503)-C(2))-methyltransferase RlmN [Bdellovibrionaceae bacterium]|nr:23S rRNA (adenine(2503)-C(2))-methyltransferase RlmN [Bdellovibrionales bacterium]MCB9086604.1 23S rRNA (adenine(2503)-C(2))-methyltransferase RlmN [Pseudobdellovibrionaceae bacterium]